MRILVLENAPSSRLGGQEHSLLDVCRGLSQRGHCIHLVHTEDGDLLDDYRQFCTSISKVWRYSIDRSCVISSIIGWMSSVISALKVDADVIYANQYHDTFFGGMLARMKGVPFLCHLRLFPPGIFCGQWRIGLPSVTRFIAGSQATRDAYLMAGFTPECMDVVYNGIDLQRFIIKEDRHQLRQSLGMPSEAFVVLYAGRIDRPKNLELLLEAFAHFSLPADKAHLLIAGSSVNESAERGVTYIEELQSLCRTYGIASSVHWLGRRSDLPELFRAADVTVLPSKLPETFGRVLIESMACGTPAIGTRLGGVPEVLCGEFDKFCFESNNVTELIALLQYLRNWRIDDPTLGMRCRFHVEENFNVGKMVTGVETSLQLALNSGPKRLGPSSKMLEAWHNEIWTILK